MATLCAARPHAALYAYASTSTGEADAHTRAAREATRESDHDCRACFPQRNRGTMTNGVYKQVLCNAAHVCQLLHRCMRSCMCHTHTPCHCRCLARASRCAIVRCTFSLSTSPDATPEGYLIGRPETPTALTRDGDKAYVPEATPTDSVVASQAPRGRAPWLGSPGSSHGRTRGLLAGAATSPSNSPSKSSGRVAGSELWVTRSCSSLAAGLSPPISPPRPERPQRRTMS